MGVVVQEIRAEDLEDVAWFLHGQMWRSISETDWLNSLRLPWSFEVPHYGFQLRDDGKLVGAYVAIFSERPIRGNIEKFCNLAAWYVMPEYRFHSIKLLKALLNQKGYHFTDLSPRPHVVKLMRTFGFNFLDTTLTIMPNLPWWGFASEKRVVRDANHIRTMLGGEALRIYENHLNIGAVRHLAVEHNGACCHVMYRVSKRKNIPCASVLYISDADVLAQNYKTVSHHLLLNDGALLTLFESRFLARRPLLSFQMQSPHRKLYRSETLGEKDIDNLYSELVTLASGVPKA